MLVSVKLKSTSPPFQTQTFPVYARLSETTALTHADARENGVGGNGATILSGDLGRPRSAPILGNIYV